MEAKDEFHMQVAGTMLAVRLVLAAVLKNHPQPEEVLESVKDLMKSQGLLEGNLPAPIQAAFDERLNELVSHLYANRSPDQR